MADEVKTSTEEVKEKCNYCDNPAAMAIENLKAKVKKHMCNQHFAEFISQGQSRVYAEFLSSMNRSGL